MQQTETPETRKRSVYLWVCVRFFVLLQILKIIKILKMKNISFKSSSKAVTYWSYYKIFQVIYFSLYTDSVRMLRNIIKKNTIQSIKRNIRFSSLHKASWVWICLKVNHLSQCLAIFWTRPIPTTLTWTHLLDRLKAICV